MALEAGLIEFRGRFEIENARIGFVNLKAKLRGPVLLDLVKNTDSQGIDCI